MSYRCKNAKQQKDKNMIYQSKEWRELRVLKYRANPLCELCEREGYVRAAQAIHHITPIETAKTMDEMKRLAYDWSNLLSVCRECHAKLHKDMKSFSHETVQQRAKDRHQRWLDRLKQRFTQS